MFLSKMTMPTSRRYWPFIIFFGYALLDLTINLLSNDLSNALHRKGSVAQRIVIYGVMLTIAVTCSAVTEFLQKRHCPQGVDLTPGSYIVDIVNLETQQPLHGQSALGTLQLQDLSQLITQLVALRESGVLSQIGVPSRSLGILEPQALPRTEGRLPSKELPQTEGHPQPAGGIPEPRAGPGTEDPLPAQDLPHMVGSAPSQLITQPQAGPGTEDPLPAQDLSQTEVHFRPAGVLPEVSGESTQNLSSAELPMNSSDTSSLIQTIQRPLRPGRTDGLPSSSGANVGLTKPRRRRLSKRPVTPIFVVDPEDFRATVQRLTGHKAML